MKTSESAELIEVVQSQLSHLLNQDIQQAHFVLGCSGGPDSVFLFHALLKLKLAFSVVHVNYFKRGEDSKADQDFVTNLCLKHGIKLHLFAAPELIEGNFQQHARKFRYQCFEKVRISKPEPAFILTAHHADDFAESVFHNVFSRKSIATSSGIAAKDEQLIRPMLQIKASNIRTYLNQHGLSYREDTSNYQNLYSRNFLRNELLPLLESRYGPTTDIAISLAHQGMVHKEMLQVILRQVSDEHSLHLEALLSISDLIQPSILGLWLEKQSHAFFPPKKLLDEVLGQLQSTPKANWSFSYSKFILFYHRQKLFLLHKNQLKPSAIKSLHLKDFSSPAKVLILDNFKIQLQEADTIPNVKDVNQLCIALHSSECTIRPVKSDDRIQVLGLRAGHKKINDCLQQAKVPLALRPLARVVEMDNHIVALLYPRFKAISFGKIGVIAEIAKIRPNTTKVLTIQHN